MKLGMYLHIPFCLQKCFYCDFNSVPLNRELKSVFLSAVKKEISLVGSSISQGKSQVSSLFWGGGTPTVLNLQDMEEIMEHCLRYFRIEQGAEFTCEANPGTVDKEKLCGLKSMGVNRISFGFQAMQDHLLKGLGRCHNVQDAFSAFSLARKAGFTNINVDVMFGLPSQTIEDLEETLRIVADLSPEHISAYSLKVEEGTPFAQALGSGVLTLPTEDEEADMYEMVIDYLSARGYQQYEISNFAKPGYVCTHNLRYWHNEQYLGFGPGAFSFFEGVRRGNCREINEYAFHLKMGKLPVAESDRLTDAEEMAETVIMGLRLRSGVDKKSFRERFGVDLHSVYGGEIDRFVAEQYMEEDCLSLRLTQKGMFVANQIMMEFLPK